MYNGIGLQTPRGSGTNGYIQTNKFFVKPRSTTAGAGGGFKPPDLPAGSPAVRKPNKELLEHDRRRQVELRLLVLREKLEEQGYEEDEIEDKVSEARKTIEMEMEEENAGDPKPPPANKRFADTQTHQIAARKEKQMETLRAALGIVKESLEIEDKKDDVESDAESGELISAKDNLQLKDGKISDEQLAISREDDVVRKKDVTESKIHGERKIVEKRVVDKTKGNLPRDRAVDYSDSQSDSDRPSRKHKDPKRVVSKRYESSDSGSDLDHQKKSGKELQRSNPLPKRKKNSSDSDSKVISQRDSKRVRAGRRHDSSESESDSEKVKQPKTVRELPKFAARKGNSTEVTRERTETKSSLSRKKSRHDSESSDSEDSSRDDSSEYSSSGSDDSPNPRDKRMTNDYKDSKLPSRQSDKAAHHSHSVGRLHSRREPERRSAATAYSSGSESSEYSDRRSDSDDSLDSFDKRKVPRDVKSSKEVKSIKEYISARVDISLKNNVRSMEDDRKDINYRGSDKSTKDGSSMDRSFVAERRPDNYSSKRKVLNDDGLDPNNARDARDWNYDRDKRKGQDYLEDERYNEYKRARNDESRSYTSRGEHYDSGNRYGRGTDDEPRHSRMDRDDELPRHSARDRNDDNQHYSGRSRDDEPRSRPGRDRDSDRVEPRTHSRRDRDDEPSRAGRDSDRERYRVRDRDDERRR